MTSKLVHVCIYIVPLRTRLAELLDLFGEQLEGKKWVVIQMPCLIVLHNLAQVFHFRAWSSFQTINCFRVHRELFEKCLDSVWVRQEPVDFEIPPVLLPLRCSSVFLKRVKNGLVFVILVDLLVLVAEITLVVIKLILTQLVKVLHPILN